jgi:acetyl esterase/lipase
VRILENVDYVSTTEYSRGKDRLDIYIPEGPKNFPVVFSIHGGLLTQGDKSEEKHIGQTFAKAGFATVVISYRLTPTVSHPGHIQDVASAFAWTRKHIAEYGGDPNRIFVTGHSAGAYLAALLALDARYLAAHGLSTKDIKAVVSVSAFYYVDRVAPDRPMQVWGTDVNTWIEASPPAYVRPDAPPFFIVYADGDEDWRQQQNIEMADALRAAGHPDVTLKKIGRRSHMSIWLNIREGDDTAQTILEFISRR